MGKAGNRNAAKVHDRDCKEKEEINESPSAHSLAHAVYRALQTGNKLPPLEHSEGLTIALLTFQPFDPLNSCHVDTSEKNKAMGGAEDQVQEKPTLCVAGYERTVEDTESEKEKFPAPVLMLEALSRRRLMAVKQLHEVCPQLLASITLFERKPCLSPFPSTCESRPSSLQSFNPNISLQSPPPSPDSPHISNKYISLASPPGTSRTPSVFRFRPIHNIPSSSSSEELDYYNCPHLRSSLLLDLAVELPTLLVFVLQHHPDVNQQLHHTGACWVHSEVESCRSSMSNRYVRGNVHCVDDMITHQSRSADNTTTYRHRLRSDDNVTGHGRHSHSVDETITRGHQSQSSAHHMRFSQNWGGTNDSSNCLSNPLYICMSKNNPEILQYLLYKHVWQNFLLHNSCSRQHGSNVPEKLSNTCSRCTWFLPCVALTGCPQLLRLVLCGQFSYHSGLVALSPVSRNNDTQHAQNTPDLDKDMDVANNGSRFECLKENRQTITYQSDQRSYENYINEQSLKHSVLYPTSGSSEHDLTTYTRNQQKSDAYAPHIASDSKFEPKRDSKDREIIHTVISDRKVAEAEKSQQELVGRNTPQTSPNEIHTPISVVPSLSLPPSTSSGSPAYDMPGTSTDVTESIPSNAHVSTRAGSVCSSGDIDSGVQKSESSFFGGYEVSCFCSRPQSGKLHQQYIPVSLPDPNKMTTVSLPVKDYLIPLCMHVKLAPLHLACWRCDAESVKVLLNLGADIHLLGEELQSLEEDIEERPFQDSDCRASISVSSNSSLDLLLDFSDSDFSVRHSSFEDKLQKRSGQRKGFCGLSPLIMLALGVRSPPNYSLSNGKSLGLVLPTFPQQLDGQVDRSSQQAKQCVLDALNLLLDAGCDVNVTSLLCGKPVRALELFLQFPRDLDYPYPLTIPRGLYGARRYTDLEHMAEIVLSVCWELCSHGAMLGSCFARSMEWNLPHMDWMFLNNVDLKLRFLHLAIFLGFFPPLDSDTFNGRNVLDLPVRVSTTHRSSTGSQSSVGRSRGHLDLREFHTPPYSPPPRPSVIPWVSSLSRITISSNSDALPSEEGEITRDTNQDRHRPQQSSEVVTSSNPVEFVELSLPRVQSFPSESALRTVSTHDVANTDSVKSRSHSYLLMDYDSPVDAHQRMDRQRKPVTSSSCHNLGSPSVVTEQMYRDRLKQHQHRCLKKFLKDAIRLSMPQSCLALILCFLCLSDLHVLASITQEILMLPINSITTANEVQNIRDAVSQAQFRTLRHMCKLAILMAANWSPSVVRYLPLPKHLKRYLLDPQP